VLINGAAGGVGTFAVQIAKALGGDVTGGCSTPNLDGVIDYTREDFTRAGRQYDLISTTSRTAPCRSAVARSHPRAHSCSTVVRPEGALARLLWPLVLSPLVRHNLRRYVSTPNRADLALLTGLLESGAIRPVIDQIFPLQETPVALRYIETGHARGKVVITVREYVRTNDSTAAV
jgi:NADPH:quinone reductase-like Zn-dependent oxidoreductase